MEHVRSPIASFALHCCSYPIGTCLNRIRLLQIFRGTCALLFEAIQAVGIKHIEGAVVSYRTLLEVQKKREHVQGDKSFLNL
jgi:hypothetical protein